MHSSSADDLTATAVGHHAEPTFAEPTFEEPFPQVSPGNFSSYHMHSSATPASAPVKSGTRTSRTNPYAGFVVPPRHSQSTPRRKSQKQQPRRSISSNNTNTTSATDESQGNSWERRFRELDEFKRLHGHCDVPQNYSENTSLGTWVNKVSSLLCLLPYILYV